MGLAWQSNTLQHHLDSKDSPVDYQTMHVCSYHGLPLSTVCKLSMHDIRILHIACILPTYTNSRGVESHQLNRYHDGQSNRRRISVTFSLPHMVLIQIGKLGVKICKLNSYWCGHSCLLYCVSGLVCLYNCLLSYSGGSWFVLIPEQLSDCQLYPLQETLAPIQETIVSVKAQNYSHQVIPTVTMCVD